MALKYINTGFCIVVILFSVVYNIKRVTPKSSPKPIFSEIIKNISRVNNLLQDVIKNYIQLERLAKSEYNIETDYKTDPEVEELFSGLGEKQERAENKPTTESNKWIATSIYYSDQSDGESESGIDDTEEKTTKKERKKSEINRSSTTASSKEDTSVITVKKKSEISEINHSSSTSSKEDTSVITVKKESKKSEINHSSFTSSKEDTSVIMVSNKSDELSDKILTGNLSVDDDLGEENVLVIHLAGSKSAPRKKTDTLSSKKIIPSRNKKQNTMPVSKAEHLVIHKPKSKQQENKEKEVLRAEDDDDVCTKAVVRKCHKALTAVLKDVCESRNRKCAREFKKDFKDNAKSGCVKQFTDEATSCRAGKEYIERTGSQASDYKKLKFLRTSCLRTLAISKETNSADSSNSIDKKRPFKILRDRYEKACKKKSYNKCVEACKYAIDKTCKRHDCISAKEKAMSKSCKKRCKETYQYSGDDSDDSDDSDDDSDDSD